MSDLRQMSKGRLIAWIRKTNSFNSSSPGRHGHHFAENICKCIFLNENVFISIKISLKFIPNGPISNRVSIGSDYGLAPHRRQAIIWTNADPIHWLICAAQGGGELMVFDINVWILFPKSQIIQLNSSGTNRIVSEMVVPSRQVMCSFSPSGSRGHVLRLWTAPL